MVLCSASPTEAPFGTLPGAQPLAPPLEFLIQSRLGPETLHL